MRQIVWVDRCLVAWGAWANIGGGVRLGLERGRVEPEQLVVPLPDDEAMVVERALGRLDVTLRKAIHAKYKDRLANRMAVRRVHRTACERVYKDWIAKAHHMLQGELRTVRYLFDHTAG